MNAPLFIARRLSLRRGHGAGRRSPAVTIAVAGIALSVAVMLITLAIVPGFRNEITHKVMGFDAQITIEPVQPVTATPEPLRPAVCPPALRDEIVAALHGAEVFTAVRLPGILKTPDQFVGLVFQAFDGNAPLDFIASNLIKGALPDYAVDSTRYDIVISSITSRRLGLDVGDRVDGYFFNNDNLRARRFNIAAIYDSHFDDYDRLISFMSVTAARALAAIPSDGGTEVQIRGLRDADVRRARETVSAIVSDAFSSGLLPEYNEVTDVFSRNPMYFNWLDLLDTNVAVIIWLMSCVGAVTLISCLFIMILERVQLIGVLKALGATNSQIIRIFLYMAERVVIRGILIGDAIGLAFVWLQWQFNLLPLDPEAYYLSSVPVTFNWGAFIILNIAAAIIALVIMLLPTLTVSRISPARVIRFE